MSSLPNAGLGCRQHRQQKAACDCRNGPSRHLHRPPRQHRRPRPDRYSLPPRRGSLHRLTRTGQTDSSRRIDSCPGVPLRTRSPVRTLRRRPTVRGPPLRARVRRWFFCAYKFLLGVNRHYGVDQDFRFAILARLSIQPPLLEPFLSFFPSRATGRPIPPILVCGLWFSLFEREPPVPSEARSWPLPERPRRQPIHWGLLAVPSNFAVVLKGS